jgi:hypothetical protein
VNIELTKDALGDIVLKGDVKFVFNGFNFIGMNIWVFHCWINIGLTSVLHDGKVSFSKQELDKAIKDKQHKLFDPSFSLAITLEETTDDLTESPVSVMAPASVVSPSRSGITCSFY